MKNQLILFTIKTRSDEAYSDLSKLLEIEFNDNIITNDLFFRTDEYGKYHISDHLILSKTNILLNGFKNVKLYCEGYLNKPNFIVSPEQIIMYFILKHMFDNNITHHEINEVNSKIIMKKIVKILPLVDWSGDVTWASNVYGIKKTNNRDWIKTTRDVIPSIHNIENL